jgi:hypothetical protein
MNELKREVMLPKDRMALAVAKRGFCGEPASATAFGLVGVVGGMLSTSPLLHLHLPRFTPLIFVGFILVSVVISLFSE